ncbi:MAG: hypothetical protein IK100_06160 [Muribaculaceae bacterium]|nr:hypothetical protein [Muribaculaceae bacterium]
MDKDTRTIDIKLPTRWEELTQKQLRYLFGLIAQGYSIDEVKAFCLFRWNKITILHRYGDNGYMCKKGKQRFAITALQVAQAIAALDWIKTLPATPIRLERIGRLRAIAADFQGVPFETFIICDNLYQGYISTQDDRLLDEMAHHLYRSKYFSLIIRLSPADRISVFYWFASLKAMFSREFRNFLQPATSDNANLLDSGRSQYEILTAAVNAQIRALTKGDVTKEKEVLALDTWRALTELDALAREYQELNSKYPSK